MRDGEEVASKNGFASKADLLRASVPLPKMEGDETQCFLTRSPDGYWFVWYEDPAA
jgi:hypothetical protein